MKPIDLYKKLPKKNCGKCRQKTCMPFAFATLKGEAELSECPELSPEEIEELNGSITKTDWREELILKLREEIKDIPIMDLAEDLGAERRNGNLALMCLGRPFTVSPDGEVTTHGHITPWVKILILHYIRTTFANLDSIRAIAANAPEKWVSYAELKSGMVKALSFAREGEEPLKNLLDADPVTVEKVLERLGAVKRGDFPTKSAWSLRLLPKVPTVLLYWPGEDEFPSKAKVLFNPSADRFLDAESIVFLIEGLVKNIEVLSAGPPKSKP